MSDPGTVLAPDAAVDGWTLQTDDSPLLATAIHHGHRIRDELLDLTNLSSAERLREEDPHTGRWAELAPTHFIVERSRFEVDLNRPRTSAVYQKPEDAWGLDLWKDDLPVAIVDESLEQYDRFYAELKRELDRLVALNGSVAVLDIHSYNHRRNGPDAPPQPQSENPDINIGTGSMPRHRWGSIVDGSIKLLSSYDSAGRNLDVRENVRFRGGEMSRWIHRNYPETVFVLAIEFKKVFMDEWSGVPDVGIIQAYRELSADLIGYLEASLR